MDILELIKSRRSIRKYTDKQISLDDLYKIIEAGLYAPNAGGGQRSKIIAVHNKELANQIGILNLSTFNRQGLIGSYVSKEQPSNIDDITIKNAFYNAPTVCIIFGQSNFLYSVPDAFIIAENMALEAHSLGISSCIIAWAEDTFNTEEGQKLLKEWNIESNMTPRCFLILGYINGVYPINKKIKENRFRIINK